MLSVTAYTLRQKARLAISLAWVGGFVDAVGFIVLAGIFTSNMTGNTALLGQRLSEWNAQAIARAGYPIAMFFLGALLSGFITVGGRRRGVQSIYSIALSLEMVLLASFMYLGWRGLDGHQCHYLMVGLPALAMGLQNATITQIAGAVVRTTHVTGVVTDLGLESVQLIFWFRDKTRGNFRQRLGTAFALSTRHPSLQRLLLLISIWGSFLTGAVLGVVGFRYFGLAALSGPIAFLMFLVGLDFLSPIAEVSKVDHDLHRHDQELKKFGIDPDLLPPGVGVYRIRGGGFRRRRAPDLGRLFECLSHQFSVVLLLMGEDVHFDENNLAGLRESLRQVALQRSVELVVCTTCPDTFQRMSKADFAEVIGRPNICPDPEFAVARAIEVLSAGNATKATGNLSPSAAG